MAGALSLNNIGLQQPRDTFVPDTTQRHVAGMVANFVDPYYGDFRAVYGKFNPGDSSTQTAGRLVKPDQSFFFTDIPNTANTALPIYVSLANMTDQDWGWFATSGQFAWQTAASVAAGTSIGIGAAGQAGTLANGKQIGNAVVTAASTKTIVLTNCNFNSGSKFLQIPNADGLIVGLAVSGTGIAGSSTIASISSDGRTIGLNNATTAAGPATITFTFTGFLIVQFNSALVEGQLA